MIYPATDRHIMKYRRQEVVTFSETTNLYEKHVKPFLEKHQFGLEVISYKFYKFNFAKILKITKLIIQNFSN